MNTKFLVIATSASVLLASAAAADTQLVCPERPLMQTTVCMSAAGLIMKLIPPGGTLPETVHIANAVQSPRDNLISTVTVDGATFQVFDLGSQGYPGQPMYAVNR